MSPKCVSAMVYCETANCKLWNYDPLGIEGELVDKCYVCGESSTCSCFADIFVVEE